MSGIPVHATRKITIPDPPSITPIDLIKQIVDNINSQILNLDIELINSNQSDAAVRYYLVISI